MKLYSHHPLQPRGFSLVEITLAMGIVVGAVLMLLSLIPSGMDNLRMSMTDTTESRIVEELSSKLQGSDWEKSTGLSGYNNKQYFFDSQGNEVPSASDFSKVYTAQLEIPPGGVALPGGATANDHLKEVRARITDRPDGVSDRFTQDTKHRLVCTLVARMTSN